MIIPRRPLRVCTGSMDVDLEGIIQCIKLGDESGVQAQLQEFNKEVTPPRNSHIFLPKLHLPAVIKSSSLPLSLSVSLLQFAQCFFFDAEERERRKVSLPRGACPSCVTQTPPTPFYSPGFSFSAIPPHLPSTVPSVISNTAVSVVPDPLSLHAQAD